MQYMGGKSRIATAIADIISKGGGSTHMRYQGGKSRIASPIADVITQRGGSASSASFADRVQWRAKCGATQEKSSTTDMSI